MKTSPAKVDYDRARRHLMRRDPALAAVIKQVGPCRLQDIPTTPPFVALAESIASQQLSVKAADTIFGRFCDLFPPDRVPDPGRLMQLSDDQIRAVGFSRPKVGFLRDLAQRVLDGRLPMEQIDRMSDEEALGRLVEVKGIGRWTAEIYLMFRLKRPDVFPADDLGLVKAAQRVYRMRNRPTPKRLLKMAETWRPYRSVAAWYLWRSLGMELKAAEKKPATKNTKGAK